MIKSDKYWFKRRRYGWGFTPVTWQGWLAVLVFIALLVGGASTLESKSVESNASESAFFLLFAALLIITFIRISLAKGPKPHWRWGKKPSDNPDEDW